MSSYESIMRSINPAFLPTPEQRAVIESASPSILVVAGAGSGKTATMANRIAYQVARGNIRPGEVLGLTFTRKAAGELAQRVERSLAAIRRAGFLEEDVRSSLARPHISTYNAFASQIAQTHGMLVGADSAARLITDAERRQLMSEALAATAVSEVLLDSYATSSIVGYCLTLAAGLIDNDVSLEEMSEFVAREHAAYVRLDGDSQQFKGMKEVSKEWSDLKKKEPLFAVRQACLPVVESYFALKRSRGLIEFADQVALATKVLCAYPQVGREISSEYRLVLLDEYQDTASGQAEFLRLALGLRDEGRSVCAVGDPNQAIYGWRGASANALSDFAVQFGPGTERLTLSTSFRSEHAILSAANRVAKGLVTEGVDVKELAARQGAGPGRITLARPVLREDSYRAIAYRIRDVFRQVYAEAEPGKSAARAPEVAVLCRKRSYFEPMIQALRELDIPYEIAGGESLVLRPEILTVRSALGVVARPARNDLLVRLLSVWALGVNDLRALHAWARHLAAERAQSERQTRGAGKPVRQEVSLIEAVTELPDESWSTPSGLALSEEGRRRLATISQILAQLRQAVHLPLAELISLAIAQLGLDVAAATRTEGSQRVKTSLDSFIALGRRFQEQHPGQALAEFLAWLDLVETHEHGGEEEAGGDEGEAEVRPGVVQIMTVHAAKGLEWRDLVAIPEMVESEFGERVGKISTWLTSADVFPEPLRKDARHLPVFRLSDHDDKIEAGQEYYRYRRELLPEYKGQEARRLAYVAFTRPSAELLLAGYGLDGAKGIKAKDGMVQLAEPSVFATDVKAVAVPLAEVVGEDWPEELLQTCPQQLTAEEAERAVGARGQASQPPMLWPGDVERSLPMRRPEAWLGARGAGGVPGAQSEGAGQEALVSEHDGAAAAASDLRAESDVQLQELDGARANASLAQRVGASPVQSASGTQAQSASGSQAQTGSLTQVPSACGSAPSGGEDEGAAASSRGCPPAHDDIWQAELFIREKEDRLAEPMAARSYVTATDVVHMADDREAYLRDLLRPIPQRPSRSARTGTELHARIAGFYERPATLDLDAVLAADQQPVDQDLMTREDERRLFEAFESSRWVDFPPVAIEESLTVVIGGRIVRCKIDAVLDTSSAPDLPDITIVDWKTGKRPTGEQVASRELQLAIYRLAWAKTHGVAVEDIGSCFVYLRDGSILMAGDLSEEEIAARMIPIPAGGGASAKEGSQEVSMVFE